MNTPDKCPKCGKNKDYRRSTDCIAFYCCGSMYSGYEVNQDYWCLERQRDQLLARVKRLEESVDAMALDERTETELANAWAKAKGVSHD